MQARSLSLVIPAWNERESIRQAIREAAQALSANVSEFELIVVDDGSTDGTADIVRAEAARDPRVRLVRHESQRGYGAALRSGFQAATLELVAYTDADCQFDLSDLSYMLPLTQHYDITCGYRIDRRDPVLRRFLSWGYNTLAASLVGSVVRDIDCALKIFHRDTLARILPESDGFFANTEMLTYARLQRMSVVEVGVHHRSRCAGVSKVSWHDIPRTLSALLPFWWTRVLFPAPGIAAGPLGRWSASGFALLCVVAAGLLFGSLSYPLLEPDEGRYAEIGRQMLHTGDWIVPKLNEQPYLDKPPLFYWLLSLSFRVFGVSEGAARFVPAGAAFLTVMATYAFGRRVVGTPGALLGAFALTLMGGFVHCGRFLILDGLLTLFVALALFTAFESVRDTRFCRGWWIASAVACALGILTKGPVAFVLLAPPVLAHTWLNRNGVRPGWFDWTMYAMVIGGLVAPWFIAIGMQNPEFAYQFLVEHHLQRFFSNDFHAGPAWFYLPVLLVGCMPWTFLLIPFTRFLLTRSISIRALCPAALGYLVLWAGWCVLFFSMSRGKLPTYVMPALPAIALLLGFYLEQVLTQASWSSVFQRARNVVPLQTISVLCITWMSLNAFAWIANVGQSPWSLREMGETTICLGVVIGIAAWGRRLPVRVSWALCSVVAMAVLVEGSHDFVPAWSRHRSMLNQSGEVAAWLRDEETAVACYGDAPPGSVPFALDRDNVRSFNYASGDSLTRFLSKHSRTLIVVRQPSDLDSACRLVPNGEIVRETVQGRRAHFLLVESASKHRLARAARDIR